MRKWKIRFVLPVCLCCLLVCGMAVGSRYAWGVTLMQRAMAASSAYQYAHVVPAGELAQALDGGCFPLHQPDCGGGGSRCARGWTGICPPTLPGICPSVLPRTAFPLWKSPPGVGLLCGRRQHPRPAALGREGVGYKGPGALPRHQLADHHLHLYLPGPAFLHRGGPLQPGYHHSFAGKPKRPVEGPGAGQSKSRSSPQTATSPSKAGFPPIQRPWSL